MLPARPSIREQGPSRLANTARLGVFLALLSGSSPGQEQPRDQLADRSDQQLLLQFSQ
jgi:hypothetical protein